LTEDDHVLTYCEPAPENACRALEEAIKETEGVQLVIIDPIFRFVRVKDSNDYAMVTKAWEPLLKLARSRGAYILTIHHLKKRESDNPIDDVLGSTAIVAGVDTILVLNSKAGSRTLQSLQRYGSNLEETMLKWNPEKRELSLGVSSDEAELLEAREIIGRIESKIFDYLSLNPDATQEAIFETVTGKTTTKKRAFREMVDSGQIKEAVLAKRGSHLPTPTPGLKRRVCQANNQATHSHNRR
jgi:RecA-family ATPase